eukprot:CAMPEP_0118721180 /NCGR_PEP_ID=MMETSP0800-20121206/30570_1 /TAXON_ID=210618 ORGANISM="Striatella unipunctata, Strain CCMP2910" /NCGR_SAMPLE_ID=MMETSP0800 /ASSEMBLY_ACC=CAM_ASM_000638 /LENGTH=88 /DNA_ID=CAMNT_0006628997 /DNA_START=27 /DNA_END=290 /DNA_ORIENTATION=-
MIDEVNKFEMSPTALKNAAYNYMKALSEAPDDVSTPEELMIEANKRQSEIVQVGQMEKTPEELLAEAEKLEQQQQQETANNIIVEEVD